MPENQVTTEQDVKKTPMLFKISSVADTGLKILPKAITWEGEYVKITATVNGVDQTISIEERKTPPQFDMHWQNLAASLINKLDCPDFVDEQNCMMKKLTIAYGKNRAISAIFLIPRDRFMDSLELKVPKLSWYSQSQLEDMDNDPDQQAASTLTLAEANLMENLTADTKDIMQKYPTMINLLEQVDNSTITEIAHDIEERSKYLELVTEVMPEP